MNIHNPKIKKTIRKRIGMAKNENKDSLKKTNVNKKKVMEQKVDGEYGLLRAEEPKKIEVEKIIGYDVVVIISSYNRLEKVKRIVDHLFTEESKFKFKLIILNDGSNENYEELSEKNSNIVLLNNEFNYGKKLYWKSITKLFTEASKYEAQAILQIDDDFILCENFLNSLMNLFLEKRGGYDNVVCIGYHLMDCSTGDRWGLSTNWIDGGGIYDYEFIKSIGFKINEIGKDRWRLNKNLSSGVWQQISNIITQKRKSIYKTDRTYVIHDGNDDSKMNNQIRNNSPIITRNV